jgi:DNA-binding PadR family transcriptional regulator
MDRQLLLLGLLRRQDMHGYGINEFIQEEMHFCIDLKKPTAYYILKQLAEQRLIEMESVQEGNRPPRRVYHVTDAGKAHFFELLRKNLSDHSATYYKGDIGIAFMDQLPSQEAASHLRQKRNKVSAELEALEKAAGHSGPLEHVLDRNRRLLQTELDWLDDLLKNLVRRPKDDTTAGD